MQESKRAKTMKSSSLKLYSYWRSSCSWRVRTALELKGLSYEYIPIHLVQDGGKQFSDEYTKLNPMKQVPTLEHDGKHLVQSLAIIEYLEEMFPSPSLFPTDSYLKSIVRAIALTICADIQPVQNLRVLKYQTGDKSEWGNHWISNGFEAVESLLEQHSGKYCVGDEVTLADLCLVPQVYNAHRFKVDMSRFPNIERVEQELAKLEAFKRAHPSQQPDCSEEQ